VAFETAADSAIPQHAAKRGPPPGFEHVAPRLQNQPQQPQATVIKNTGKRGLPPGFEHIKPRTQPRAQQPQGNIVTGEQCGRTNVIQQMHAVSPFAAYCMLPWETTGPWYTPAVSPFAAFSKVAFTTVVDAGAPKPSTKRGPTPGFEHVVPRTPPQPQQPQSAVKAGKQYGLTRVTQQTAAVSPFAAHCCTPWQTTGPWYTPATSPFAAFSQVAFEASVHTAVPTHTAKRGPPPGFEHMMPRSQQHNLQQQQQQPCGAPTAGQQCALTAIPQHTTAITPCTAAAHCRMPWAPIGHPGAGQVLPECAASLCSSASDSLESLLACCMDSSDKMNSSGDEVHDETSEGCETEGETEGKASGVCVITLISPVCQVSMLCSSSSGSLADLVACCMGQQQ
jgi:hypothetical protein